MAKFKVGDRVKLKSRVKIKKVLTKTTGYSGSSRYRQTITEEGDDAVFLYQSSWSYYASYLSWIKTDGKESGSVCMQKYVPFHGKTGTITAIREKNSAKFRNTTPVYEILFDIRQRPTRQVPFFGWMLEKAECGNENLSLSIKKEPIPPKEPSRERQLVSRDRKIKRWSGTASDIVRIFDNTRIEHSKIQVSINGGDLYLKYNTPETDEELKNRLKKEEKTYKSQLTKYKNEKKRYEEYLRDNAATILKEKKKILEELEKLEILAAEAAKEKPEKKKKKKKALDVAILEADVAELQPEDNEDINNRFKMLDL